MDAMVGEDLDYLASKPNFSRIFKNSARVGRVTTIFPSITYPAHVSMMTGCRPGKTGIYTNYVVGKKKIPGDVPWHLDADEIRVEDYFAAARRAGRSTAAVYWPVTGNNPNIDLEINELFFYLNEEIEPRFRQYGANDEAMAVIRENLFRFPKAKEYDPARVKNNGFDDFIMGCVCSLIRRDRPDFLVAHNCILDTARHRNGVFHENVTRSLDITDAWLGEVADAMEEAGVLADTDFILCSDHGQRNNVRNMKLNVLLKRRGFLETDEEGHITNWRARCVANGMSAYIYLHDRADEQTKGEVLDYLKTLAADGVWGFNEVYTADEIKEKYGTWGDFDFALNTDGYSSFSESAVEPPVGKYDFSDYRSGKATHGYFPEDGAQPVFVAVGPSFKPGAYIERADVIDEAPTIAHIMGETLPEAEGKCLCALLKRP